jgi:hypothetical protein
MNYDVFLSHNSKDKPAVKTLGTALKKRGLSVWLDEWELRPGLPWQDALEDIITGCKSAMVCFGGSGVGPWEESEMQALLRQFVSHKRIGNVESIIPVLLPGAPADVTLPLFLQAFTWVDLRNGLTADALDRLRWGITGEKPRENTPTVCLAKATPDLRKARDTVANYLTSAKLNVLPAKPYSADPSKFLPALEADLVQADVFVQILGATYADRTEELPKGEELAQFQRAQKSGKVILQWRDKSVDLDAIDDPPHRELVGGADVRVCHAGRRAGAARPRGRATCGCRRPAMAGVDQGGQARRRSGRRGKSGTYVGQCELPRHEKRQVLAGYSAGSAL